MGRITSSNVLDACVFFLSSPEFRLQGLDVMKQVSLSLRVCVRALGLAARMVVSHLGVKQ